MGRFKRVYLDRHWHRMNSPTGCASSPLPWCQSLHHSLPSLIFRKLCCSCGVAQFKKKLKIVTQILSLYFLWQVWNDAATQVLLPVPTLFFLWHDLLAGHWCCNRWGQPILLLEETFNKFSITPNVTTCAKVPLMVMFCIFIRFLTPLSWSWMARRLSLFHLFSTCALAFVWVRSLQAQSPISHYMVIWWCNYSLQGLKIVSLHRG